MTRETIIFLLNHMLTYCITVDLGNTVLNVNIASVSSNYSIENTYYLHRTCIGKINRNYQVTREVTDQGAQLVISVVPHFGSDCVYLPYLITTQISVKSEG